VNSWRALLPSFATALFLSVVKKVSSLVVAGDARTVRGPFVGRLPPDFLLEEPECVHLFLGDSASDPSSIRQPPLLLILFPWLTCLAIPPLLEMLFFLLISKLSLMKLSYVLST